MILSFKKKSQGENKLVKSIKVLPENIKSNPMQEYPHIIESFGCILNMFVFMPNKFLIFFRNMFYSKAIFTK